MPPQFQATYTPIAAAGTGNQIKHLARMMSSQFVAAGVKPKDTEVKCTAYLVFLHVWAHISHRTSYHINLPQQKKKCSNCILVF